MKKTKILTLLVLGLLISNLVLAGFIVFRKPNHPDIDAPKRHIIKKLHFSEEQVKKYEPLIKKHREDIAAAEGEIMLLKNKLYSLLKEGENPAGKDSLINEIGKVQLRIETIHYNHFVDIKTLCNADQQTAFNELTSEIAGLFAHPRPKDNKK